MSDKLLADTLNEGFYLKELQLGRGNLCELILTQNPEKALKFSSDEALSEVARLINGEENHGRFTPVPMPELELSDL